MGIEIHEESAAALDAYAQVPIAFRVDRAFEVTAVDGGAEAAPSARSIVSRTRTRKASCG